MKITCKYILYFTSEIIFLNNKNMLHSIVSKFLQTCFYIPFHERIKIPADRNGNGPKQ